MSEPVPERDIVMGVYTLVPSCGFDESYFRFGDKDLEIALYRTPEKAEEAKNEMRYGDARRLRVTRVKLVEY